MYEFYHCNMRLSFPKEQNEIKKLRVIKRKMPKQCYKEGVSEQ